MLHANSAALSSIEPEWLPVGNREYSIFSENKEKYFKLQICSVERGIYPIAKSTMDELFL